MYGYALGKRRLGFGGMKTVRLVCIVGEKGNIYLSNSTVQHHNSQTQRPTDMALSSEPPHDHHQTPPSKASQFSAFPSKICVPLLFSDSPKKPSFIPLSSLDSTQTDSVSSNSEIKGVSSSAESNSGFPSTVRIAGLNSNGKGGGPAFVGQVFSMCDLSGTGLMAVSTHFDIPFISKRTPEWLKKMFAAITKSERNGPVFRFFIDLGDAVSYVKRLNIPSGVVGACRLDLAYEHFKEKPHLFQFVPNEKQVKAANKLLKTIPQNGVIRKMDGVPVFSAQNLDIAIATTDGIKWYTPYFFDKSMLDNILEESVDQHFHALIQTRHMQRRRDVVDDNLAAEVIEEMGDNAWEPPEVQEVLDEMGNPGIPLSVISKAAEMQVLYAVDKVILGNRWLRKATGIQPKFPYMVDSFERRSEASFLRASELTSPLANLDMDDSKDAGLLDSSACNLNANNQETLGSKFNIRLPFGDWFHHLWPKRLCQTEGLSRQCIKEDLQSNPFLPKITMVGISTRETGQMSKSSLKKTMEDLTKELEQTEQGNAAGGSSNEDKVEDRDPLFVANVGDYYSGVARTGAARWVRGGNN
ncbi:Tic22-like protein [Quillaja saponaria]|uniref:Tic22-like protein n=1 Tax=Quillaja saponaria TaxID=32244 RepID=A0AAD7PVY8_QUISA|nr:Tic22-like protein [Quillaja saponaria]